ncbi:MAG: hypothetical protein KAS98_04975 [Deltaproteobacteria bacterium]|jgi:carbonic anhydrase/acetyltransferase-like protein (isoleucine patch superfamily)|nr:hypothetical protein [Pseudomonadota bacterium]MCK5009816.1 hypothetical protein [Deltaproteobacteria bacterium]MCK5515186.1 hypothetical protein [Deltaproteobacteria bacterium]
MLYKFDDNQPRVGKDTYVSGSAKVIGNALIGDNCYIGHGSILRGDYGRIEIGDGTAVEEGGTRCSIYPSVMSVARVSCNVSISITLRKGLSRRYKH